MRVNPIQYRTPATVKADLQERKVAGYYFTRKNLTRLPEEIYQNIMAVAQHPEVTRVVVNRETVKVDSARISKEQIDLCVTQRPISSGAKVDTRHLPILLQEKANTLIGRLGKTIRSISLKLMVLFYSLKIRLVKRDLNLMQFANPSGEKITAFIDYPEEKERSKDITWLIIPPAFGKRKETYYLLALYLKKNGFGVVRYDDSNSIGESDGEIKNTTLSRSTENILTIVDVLARKFGAKKIGLIPFSLSARPAIKAATQDKRINFLLPVVGSPSIQTLLNRVYGEDLIADYAAGKRKGILNLLGWYIDSTSFLGNAHENGFADLESTAKDMKDLGIPMIWYCGTEDPWVDHKEVDMIIKINPMGQFRRLKVFDGLTHRFRDAEYAHVVFAQVVRDVSKQMKGHEIKEVARPWTGEVIERGMRERARIKTLISEEEKLRMWTNYLKGFGILLETDDYIDYLKDIDKLLHFMPNEKLLDVGCGNGYVINYILNRIVDDVVAKKYEGNTEGQIVGIDLVQEALDRAEKIISETKMKHQQLPPAYFLQHNIKEKLPFPDWSFDTLCLSLVLSYINDPQTVVRECCRVLKPGGRIIISSLKPDADVSQIYARFLEKKRNRSEEEGKEEEWKQGRDLFNKAINWIEGHEETGLFSYYGMDALREFLQQCGLRVKMYKSFGGQAIIAYGEKPI